MADSGSANSLPHHPSPPTTIRKELVIEEEALQLLLDRHSTAIDVYTAGPSYPASGMLNDIYQGTRITVLSKLLYGFGSFVLLGVAYVLSFYVTADAIYASPYQWKFVLILFGHGLVIGLAYWICHFMYRKRVEELLYGTIDDGTAAYGRCGVATMEKGGDGGGGGVGGGAAVCDAGTGVANCGVAGGPGAGVVEMSDTAVSSASMNSLEAGTTDGAGGGGTGKEEVEDDGGGIEQPYHAMT